MLREIQETDGDVEATQDSNPMSINFSPIGSDDSRFIDLSPINEDSQDRPPRYFRKNGDLRSVEEIPFKYRRLFETFDFFNLVQSRVMDNVLYTDQSLVVSAPTGSGKTTIFELAIVRLLMTMEDIHYTGDYKIIYMAPIKSLCSERLCDWNNKFLDIGLSCIQVTGDTERLEFRNLENYKIIITTPEKWDSITRKWKDNKEIVKVVKLFMIDEIHLLGDRKRGPTLEAVVSRMKIIQKSILHDLRHSKNKIDDDLKLQFLAHVRFVALSATIKNIDDIGQWLCDQNNTLNSAVTTPAITQEFGEEYRPVQLTKIVLGYMSPSTSSPYRFDLSLNYKLKSVIEKYSNNKPTLVFCTTRKGLIPTAEILCKSFTFRFSEIQKKFLMNSIKDIKEKKLRDMLSTGIGWHHAGMQSDDRCLVENLFRSGVVPILLTTSTLSMGVNLPAHLVIIKSTEIYQSHGYENYSQIAMQQMIGRAGRPQFDSSATAVIMTKTSLQKYYEDKVMGTEIIESNLHKHLGEHLNAEVVLRTITDIVIALDWVKTTFLYVRILRNPKYYGLTQPALTFDKIEKKLIELCQIEINKLRKLQLIETDEEMGLDLKPTRNGELMAQYYLTYTTMQLFLKLNGTETVPKLLNMISESDEFLDIHLRVTDKKILNNLNKCRTAETIRFPLPGKINNRSMKINCLIQSVFGALPLDNSLKHESENIMKIGERISHCLCQYLITQKKGFVALRNALVLAKCFNARLWENSKLLSRQFERIGPVTANLLASTGKVTFDDILASNPRDLERITNRAPPFGNSLLNYVKHLPKFYIRMMPPDVAAAPPRFATVTLEFANITDLENLTTTGKKHVFSLLVGDTANNILLYKKYRDEDVLMVKRLAHQVELAQDNEHELFGCALSESWVGLDIDITRKMPPVSRYLINSFKKQLEIPVQNTVTEISQENDTNRKQLSVEKEQKAQDTKEGNVTANEDCSTDDVLNLLISSVFDKKSPPKASSIDRNTSIISEVSETGSSHTYHNSNECNKPKDSKNSSNSNVAIICTPPNGVQKTLLIPESPNLKYYYEHVSSVLKNRSTAKSPRTQFELNTTGINNSGGNRLGIENLLERDKRDFVQSGSMCNASCEKEHSENLNLPIEKINSNFQKACVDAPFCILPQNFLNVIEEKEFLSKQNGAPNMVKNSSITFNSPTHKLTIMPKTQAQIQTLFKLKSQNAQTRRKLTDQYESLESQLSSNGKPIQKSPGNIIPDREPSFECEQGKVWVSENFSTSQRVDNQKFPNYLGVNSKENCITHQNQEMRNLPDFAHESMISMLNPKRESRCLQSVENLPKQKLNSIRKETHKVDNATMNQSQQILVPIYEMISDEEESNSSLVVETSGLDNSQILEDEDILPVKKAKFNDEESTIRCCQIYRHKKFGKCSVLPMDDENETSPVEKLLKFKQSSKKKLSEDRPNIKILKIENVHYPNIVDNKMATPSKSITWRSPLTSEKNISTSSSDMSSPVCMTNLSEKYSNSVQISDYQLAKVSTKQSTSNASGDVEQKATYSIREKKYVIHEIHVKKKVENRKPSSRPSTYQNNQVAEKTYPINHPSMYEASSSSHFRKFENQPENKLNQSSGCVQNSEAFKHTMKGILFQLSDKGASEASMASENNDTQDLFSNTVTNFSVRSDYPSVHDYKLKPRDNYYTTRTDELIQKSKKQSVEPFQSQPDNVEAKTSREHLINMSVSSDETISELTKGKNFPIYDQTEKSKNQQYPATPISNSYNTLMNTPQSVNLLQNTVPNNYQKEFVGYTIFDNKREPPRMEPSFMFRNPLRSNAFGYRGAAIDHRASDRIRGLSQHYSNYVPPMESHSRYLDQRPLPPPLPLYQSPYHPMTSNTNLVRLEDGPLVDLNEVNRLQAMDNFKNDIDKYNYSRSLSSQQNLFNLSPKSFMKTLKIPKKQFNSRK